MKQVNFLHQRLTAQGNVERSDRRWLRWAEWAAGGILSVFGVVLTAWLIGWWLLSGVQTQRQALEQQVLGQEAVERSVLLLSAKLDALAQLTAVRKQKQDTIAAVDESLDTTVFIVGLEFDQKQQLLLFRLQSQDVLSLNNVLSLVNSSEFQSKFTSVNASQIDRQKNGAYLMTLAVVTK
jgi:hypothetical protein